MHQKVNKKKLIIKGWKGRYCVHILSLMPFYRVVSLSHISVELHSYSDNVYNRNSSQLIDMRNSKNQLNKNKKNRELMLTYDTPAYMFNVYKNQPSLQIGSRNLMDPKTLPTIWGTYMKLVTKYQISAINSCWEKCDEIYLGWKDGQR